MWLRRLLLVTLVACAAMSLPKAKAESVDLDGQKYEFQCPIADGYQWRFDASKLHANRVHIAQVSSQSFHNICDGQRRMNMYTIACAFDAQHDATTGDNYSAILTTNPPSTMSEATLIHELCHTQGWVHE